MRRLSASCLALCLVGGATTALADRVILENGNVLEGRAQRRGQEVVVHSALGTLAVPAASVRRIEQDTPHETELMQLLDEARTVAELLQVAERCRAAGAGTLARRALERVLALEPDHAVARAGLGYRRDGDAWTLVPRAPQVRPDSSSRAERELVAALLANSPSPAPLVHPAHPQSVVIAPALAWPPLGIGTPTPPSRPDRPVASPSPPASPPPAPVARARSATRGRFAPP